MIVAEYVEIPIELRPAVRWFLEHVISVRSRRWHRNMRREKSQKKPLPYLPNTVLIPDLGVNTAITGLRWSELLFCIGYLSMCYHRTSYSMNVLLLDVSNDNLECVLVGDGFAKHEIGPRLVAGDKLIRRGNRGFLPAKKGAKIVAEGRKEHEKARNKGGALRQLCQQICKQSTIIYVEFFSFFFELQSEWLSVIFFC